jgi:hypothetical protein
MIRQKLRENFRRNTNRLLRRKRAVMEFGIRPYLLRPRVRHLHGPTKICYDIDELLLMSVVRNGELYIRSFMDHYRSIRCDTFCVSR